MNEILTSDDAILWRGQEPPLKMAVLLTRQRPWLTWCGARLVAGERSLGVGDDLAAWVKSVAVDGKSAGPAPRGKESVIGWPRSAPAPSWVQRCHRCDYCGSACQPHPLREPCNLACGCIEAMWR